MRLIAEAELRGRKLRRAATVALLSGIALATFAGLSVLWTLGELAMDRFAIGLLDWQTLVIAAALGVAAWNEFRGRRMLRQFDPRGPRVLGFNQVGLGALLVVYALWMIAAVLLGPNPYAEIIAREPRAAGMLGGIGDLYRKLAIASYGAMIVATMLCQGLTAAYYFSRGAVLKQYLCETPAWLVELQRTTGG